MNLFDSDLSVITPVLNEKERLPSFLNQVQKILPQAQLIIVDGGSVDGTWEWLQEQPSIQAFQELPNRGKQMDQGARASSRDYLLFLHVDCDLLEGAGQAMQNVLYQPGVSGGAFKFAVDHPDSNYRLMEKLVNWRSRVFQLPYGDQGIFVKRSVYETVGGLKPLPLMEDVDFCRRLKRVGRIALASCPLLSSPRRMQRRGFWRSCVRNVILVFLFHLGVSAQTLKRIYDSK